MNNNNYLLSDTIVFDAKPIAVPYNYRVSYKIAQLLLIISLCCSRGGCSLIKLHMISMSLNSDASMDQMEQFANGLLSEIPLIRFDPTVNRALMLAINEGVIMQQQDGKVKLSPKGRLYVSKIMDENDLMVREKKHLKSIASKITEKRINEIMANWRYQSATD